MEYLQHELGGSIMTILAFNLFANTTWGICYENRKTPLGNSEYVDERIKGLIDSL
jgi:hypothetical protein